MHQLISDNIDQIRALCDRYRVKALYAFGSVCTGQFHGQSDVDLLISFEAMDPVDYADNYFLMADALESILQRPVDLITEKSLSNPYFIQSVNQTKQMIYGSGSQKAAL
jgi:predicted nucleotidyltransferase